jgi:ribonuclease BN (tRNA processing enzyme)
LILDAGSGLLFADDVARPVNILLGHLHLDHTVGLATYPPVWDKNDRVRVYTRDRAGQSLLKQVFGVYAPPYWPVDMADHTSAEVKAIYDDVPFKPDEVFTVTPFAANHPDGAHSFIITDGAKTVAYLLDYEIETLKAPAYDNLVDYCLGADLIICETTYHPDDYRTKRGWGHSTVHQAARLADDTACRRMMFAHYSFEYSDEALDSWAGLLENTAGSERFIFSRDGMELEL